MTEKLALRKEPILSAALITFVLAILFFSFPQLITDDDDAQQYVSIAEGHIGTVIAPFPGRALFALIARAVAILFRVDIVYGFAILALLSIFAFYYFVFSIVSDYSRNQPVRLYILLSAIPFTWFAFGHAAMPEPIGFALTAGAFWHFQRNRTGVGIGLIACAMATRESYVLLLLVVCIWMLLSRNLARLWLGLACGAAAWMVVRFFSNMGAPNVHDMNPTAYMLMKVPVNLASEVFGVEIWTNGYSWCDSPMFTMKVPAFLLKVSGKITEIGACGIDPLIPLGNLYLLLAEFATLPIMLWLALQRRRPEAPEWLLVCMVYGAVMFVLGICTGKSEYRLLTYAWPLFLLGAPIVSTRCREIVIDRKLFFLNASLIVSSLIYRNSENSYNQPTSYMLTVSLIILAVLIYVIAYPLYKNSWQLRHNSEFTAPIDGPIPAETPHDGPT